MQYHIRFPFVKYENANARRAIVDAGYPYVLGMHNGDFIEIPVTSDDKTNEVVRRSWELQELLSNNGVPDTALDYVIVYDPKTEVDYSSSSS